MKEDIRWTQWGLVFFLITGMGFVSPGCRHQQMVQDPLTPVRVREVQMYGGGDGVPYSANIVPYTQVEVPFKSGGYIQSILQVRGADGRWRNVQQGDQVAKDTILAQVREIDYQNHIDQAQGQLAEARAAYEQARVNFDRANALFATQSLTKPDYDSAKARLDSTSASVKTAQAGVAQAEQALSDCKVRAPMTGWILGRNVEVGSLVGQGTPGFSMADLNYVKAVFGVPDVAMKSIKLGEVQTVATEAIPEEFRGRITSISPAADPKSRVFSVEVTLPNPKNLLKAGMIATLTLGATRLAKPVMIVPLSAVVRSAHNPSGFAIFVVEDQDKKSFVHLRDVQTGDTYGNMIAVTHGVNAGERVVTVGATLARDGQQVQVIP